MIREYEIEWKEGGGAGGRAGSPNVASNRTQPDMRTIRLSGHRTQARHHTTRSLKIICQTEIESESKTSMSIAVIDHGIHASEMCVRGAWRSQGSGDVLDEMRMRHKYIKYAR